jgi:hypothetical protein
MFHNFKESFDEPEELDGFEDMRADDQNKIRKAWAVGEGTPATLCTCTYIIS